MTWRRGKGASCFWGGGDEHPRAGPALRAVVLFLASVLALPVQAQSPTPAPKATSVVILADKNTRPYREAARGIQGAGLVVENVPLAKARARLSAPAAAGEIFVALGPKSAKLLSQSPKSGAAALIRSSEVPARIPSVTVDVPAPLQLPWISRAFPGRTRVVVLRGKTEIDEGALKTAAPHLRFVVVNVDKPESAVFALERALEVDRGRTVVWLLPDPQVITANTIGPLAQQALSARVPVVGFSGYFLRVGALAAVETNYEKMGRAALDAAVTRFEKSEDIEVTSPASKMAIAPPGAVLAVNAKLAARLGIAVRDGNGVVFK